MSQNLLQRPSRSASRRQPQLPTRTAAGSRPEMDRVLREVAFVCRLTERIKQAVVGRKGTLVGATV